MMLFMIQLRLKCFRECVAANLNIIMNTLTKICLNMKNIHLKRPRNQEHLERIWKEIRETHSIDTADEVIKHHHRIERYGVKTVEFIENESRFIYRCQFCCKENDTLEKIGEGNLKYCPLTAYGM
ncbi:hypothetical protein GWI33_013452 [Rhynchophorus ferrugineus]|uniref:Uncharacterized protein n=1 Tax=Rhynchophorus ferrugineus TaxID=354439 RepID=A0A834I710_RHYFE|nr:hypothetical protein GWI33_013452 [Rhynchophorus ferrugineus]